MLKKPNYKNLSSDVFKALSQHYANWTSEHVDDDIYAYVIYTPPLVNSVTVSVLTEQGLAKVASTYKTKHGYKESLEQLAADLRWSMADSPYCAEQRHQKIFNAVNARLQPMMEYVDSLDEDDPAFDKHVEKLYAILVDALNQFRNETLGGDKSPLLYVDFGDMSDEERLSFIKQCNGKKGVKSYLESYESA
jgi:hypothetical protein